MVMVMVMVVAMARNTEQQQQQQLGRTRCSRRAERGLRRVPAAPRSLRAAGKAARSSGTEKGLRQPKPLRNTSAGASSSASTIGTLWIVRGCIINEETRRGGRRGLGKGPQRSAAGREGARGCCRGRGLDDLKAGEPVRESPQLLPTPCNLPLLPPCGNRRGGDQGPPVLLIVIASLAPADSLPPAPPLKSFTCRRRCPR